MTGISYDELVTAATVGVSRKGRPDGPLAGPAGQAGQAGTADPEPAAALLDAAALMTAARRAGLQPVRGLAATADAAFHPDGTERELSARAARLLRRVRPTTDGDLLADLLSAARDAGYVLSAPLLPALLDAAVRDTALRPPVAALLGARGRWLAGHRPDWRRVVGQAQATEAATPDSSETAVITDRETRTWRTGGRDERRGVLAALRRHDPAAGRELLAAGWSKENAADRAALLDMLRHGLSAADEEFLEAALDDRSGGVRETAQELLARLPGSAFRRRAAERAAPLLRVERHALRRRLAVTLPAEPDAAAARDGVPKSSEIRGIGDGAWRLIHVLAAAPLGGWAEQLGLHVHAAWRRAVTQQRDSALSDEKAGAWALALLASDVDGTAKWGYRVWPEDAALTAALPPGIRVKRTAERLDRAVALLGVGSDDSIRGLAAEVAACPVPWAPALADAVAGVLTRAAAKPSAPALPRALLTLAGRGLPADGPRDYAATLATLARPEPPWSSMLNNAAETIALRRAFRAELRLPGRTATP
jgi:Family of unknown function (DUF5691)